MARGGLLVGQGFLVDEGREQDTGTAELAHAAWHEAALDEDKQ